MNAIVTRMVWVFAVVLGLLFGMEAQAQASRTWVSGVGDDANPCSRTAPCKTFAGAISKTATGGEISVLDPGGYGAVTITKSIIINSEGAVAGILSAGTNGVIVNAPSTAVVTLRNINIECFGTGLNGIRFLAGGLLNVENVTIRGCNNSGIDAQTNTPGGTSRLQVHNVTFTSIASVVGGDAAISLRPAAGNLNAVISDSRINGNNIGVRIEDRVSAVIRDSTLTGNTRNGVILSSAGALAQVTVQDSTLSFNGPDNAANAGIRLASASTIARITGNTITGNGNGLLNAGGQILSFGNNRIDGNVFSDGAPTMLLPQD